MFRYFVSVWLRKSYGVLKNMLIWLFKNIICKIKKVIDIIDIYLNLNKKEGYFILF
ncbi:hypothetical protein GCM10009504_47380 [Pseudomonas laurentiana]|nr:hypothetical protein GCM10009504_47380 [Pseudomonas laurentiana]